ncbi:MAG: hypothetical protein R2873_28815 [Caldilineaceae bacterium]
MRPLRWQLQNADGNPVAALDTRPRYNGISADSWPPGTFVDDGYEMPLPPDLPAGEYQLSLQFADTAPVVLGTVTLTATPPTDDETPTHELRAMFGDVLALAGYNVDKNDRCACR